MGCRVLGALWGSQEVGGHLGVLGYVGGVRGVLGAGRDSRHTGARRGIRASGGIGAPGACSRPFWVIRGCRGCQGCIGG